MESHLPAGQATAASCVGDEVPPPLTGRELDQLQYHISLQEMGIHLQNALNATNPSGYASRYTDVCVLLLSWEDEDPLLPVSIEIAELEDVFDRIYHFDVHSWKIPSEGSQKRLTRRVLDFIEHGGDNAGILKIVYYGGHGMLATNRQSCWANRPDINHPGYRYVKWGAIQAVLEEIESDVLLLLDCCASGTANTDVGHGVTELIAASGFNTSANPVGPFSFTTALITELRGLSQKPSFTVGALYNKILCRLQNWMPTGQEMQKPPLHVVLTQSWVLPRSIKLSPRHPPPFAQVMMADNENLGSDEPSCIGGPGISVKRSRSESCNSEDPAIKQLCRNDQPCESDFGSVPCSSMSSSSESTPQSVSEGLSPASSSSSVASEPESFPRILLTIRLKEDWDASNLSERLFADWLEMMPLFAKHVKIEAGFASMSTLLLVSLPVAVWCYLPRHPAIAVISMIKSSNLLQLQEPTRQIEIPDTVDSDVVACKIFPPQSCTDGSILVEQSPIAKAFPDTYTLESEDHLLEMSPFDEYEYTTHNGTLAPSGGIDIPRYNPNPCYPWDLF